MVGASDIRKGADSSDLKTFLRTDKSGTSSSIDANAPYFRLSDSFMQKNTSQGEIGKNELTH